ncbi:MAG: high-affinity iron transporter [Acidimicrobiaceae bacterium]
MLPTFVIGLREGVEASLIVGIIAAFLGQQGRRDSLRWVWAGVGLAVALCLAVGIALHLLEDSLPQKEQEALETVVGLVAIAMVTWMIVWMRKHSRGLKREIESSAGAALVRGSAKALVGMAFLAVLREGFETSFFLVALLQNADSQTSGLVGAVLGIAVACVIGFALYKGGLRLDLARFFKATGVVLVVVVAGLAAFAAHTAHEATWLTIGQGELVDLSSFVKPGSVQAALVTGILGIQPKPVVAEAVAWLAAFVPLLAFVLWPPRRRTGERDAASAAASDDGRVAVGGAS